MDLSTKKAVVVKVGPESQLHKLPTMAAQMIAFRLKGGATGAAAGPGSQAGSQRASGPPASGSGNWNGDGQGGAPGGGGWRNANGGPPDFQQMLSRTPEIKIADLNKGDAVMLVATEGTANNGPTCRRRTNSERSSCRHQCFHAAFAMESGNQCRWWRSGRTIAQSSNENVIENFVSAFDLWGIRSVADNDSAWQGHRSDWRRHSASHGHCYSIERQECDGNNGRWRCV